MGKVRAKKHLGQHFLNDLNVAQKIADSLQYQADKQVLEIGPGMGVLTQFLLKKDKRSFCYRDRQRVSSLSKNSLPSTQ